MFWRELLALATYITSRNFCVTDEHCSLNGVCTRGACQCDPGWISDDCGVLDLRPAKANSGYNLTSQGTSSWGSTIIHDPSDPDLYHLFAAEFTHGCGLDHWAPYSRIIRAESRTGPAGPYEFAAEVLPAFAHNPTVVYSPTDKEWFLYYIGCKQDLSSKCQSINFTCGPGNQVNGESGISMMRSKDLHKWHPVGQVFSGDTQGWDADLTNPAPLPGGMLLAYRGCPVDCLGLEQINLAIYADGAYTRLQANPIFPNPNEDPFLWRDKRGHHHMLLHSLERDGGFGDGPKVGRHAFARHYTGPWTFCSETLAYSTEVQYNDGSSINLFRRERPQLYFSDDGEMTPLLLTNGAQAPGNSMSYSIVVPIGDEGVKAI